MGKMGIRVFLYLLGLLLLALGITLNTAANLGVSPIISVAYAVSEIKSYSFSDMTFLLYSFFVIVEMLIHLVMKKPRLIIADLSQVAVTLIFTRILRAFEILKSYLPEHISALAFNYLPFQLAVLTAGIIFTGIGAALSINMRIAANPGDGIVQTLSDLTGVGTGLVKNLFVSGCVLTACLISYVMSGEIVGIGIGTLIAMFGVGRVIALFNRISGTDKYAELK